MIAIRINRTDWLELPNDIQLDITRVSPVFSEDKVFEENSVYNFTVPGTPHNNAILGHPQRAMAIRPQGNKYIFELFYDNNLIAEGTTFVVKCNSKYIEIVTALNESSFLALFGDKYITDFNYGGPLHYDITPKGTLSSVLNVVDFYYPDVPFAYFPVRNDVLYSGHTNDWLYQNAGIAPYEFVENRPYQNDYMFLPNPDTGGFYPEVFRPDYNAITPFPYVGRILKGIFEESGYVIKHNDFLKDNSLKKLVIYNPNITPYDAYSNLSVLLSDHLPKMKVAEFISVFKKPFGLNFLINEIDRSVDMRLFKNLNDSRQTMLSNFTEDNFEQGTSLTYKSHVDSSCEFASKWQKPDEIEKGNYLGEVITYSQLSSFNPVVGDIAFVWEVQYYYIYSKETDNSTYTWNKLAYNSTNVKIGDASSNKDIQLDFSGAFCEEYVVPNYTHTGWQDDKWSVPVVNINGNMKRMPLISPNTYNEFELKLMFYWGMGKTDLLQYNYPIGSSSIYKGNSGNAMLNTTPELPSLSLFPNHQKNFIDTYLTKYNSALFNKRVRTLKTVMRVSELKEIDFLRSVQMHGRLWLITKVQFKLSNSGVSPVEIELTEVN